MSETNEAVVVKKARKAKAEKVVKEKAARDAYGSRPGTECATINAAFSSFRKPVSVKELAEKAGLGTPRVRNHVYWLAGKDFAKKVGKDWTLAAKASKPKRVRKSRAKPKATENAEVAVAE